MTSAAKTTLIGAAAICCAPEGMCFAPPCASLRHGVSSLSMAAEPAGHTTRRNALALAGGAALFGFSSSPARAVDAPKIPEKEMIQPPATSCAQGVGGKCEELAEGNEFILKLQKRSAENRLKYQKEELESYWRRNYKDFFDSACTKYDKTCDLRENPDGTWTVGEKPDRFQTVDRSAPKQ